jgi:hypothetical protein
MNEDIFLELATQMQAQNGQVELCSNNLMLMKSELFNNEKAHLKFLQSLDSLLLAYPIGGINIDIEYAGENSQTYANISSPFYAN